MANKPNLSNRVSVILIIIVGLTTGAGALRGTWHFDDYYTVVHNDALRKPANILNTWRDPSLFSADPMRSMYRPVLVISYILNFLLLGEDPRGFLLINLLLHLVNAVLTWALARSLMQSGGAGTAPAKGGEAGALLAGLIYAVHPAASQGIAYVSDRSAVLATTFILGSLLAYIRWDRRGSVVSLLGAVALFMLGLGTKAIAIVLPAIAVIYHLSFPSVVCSRGDIYVAPIPSGPGRIMWRRAVAGISALSLPGLGYLVLRKAVMGVVLASSLVRPLEENLLTQARAYIHYLRLFLWPVHQSINPYFRTYSDPFDPEVIFSLLVLAGLTAVGLILSLSRRDQGRSASPVPGWRVFGFGLLFMLVSFLPESSIVPLNLVVSERRMIFPLVGYSLSAGAILSLSRGRWRVVIALCLLISMSSLTFLRLRDWRSEESVWGAAVRVDPDWGLLWNNVGLIYLGKGDTFRAMSMFELAARHDRRFAEARLNLGHMYARWGDKERAEKYSREALSLAPAYANAAASLAQLWNESGKREQARRFMHDFASLYPAPRALYLVGVFSEEDGQFDSALDFYRKAVAAAPFDPLPNLALAKLLGNHGRRDEALLYLKRFLSVYPVQDSYRVEALRLANKISSER